MTITTEMLLLAGVAAALLVLVGLVVSIWRGVAARREVAALREELADRERTLQAAQLEVHGKAVELEQLATRLMETRREVEGLKAQVGEVAGHLQAARTREAEVRTELREREDRHGEQLALLTEARDNLKKEFEILAHRIFDERGKSFTASSRASMEDLLKPFREQISGFQQRINEVHTESVKGNTALEAEIRKVLEVGLEMNSQASNLTQALKGDKKATGNWGEAQLERTLELAGLVKGEHYETQASFADDAGKRKVPDFIIRLPENKSLVIDSKVSLVDYDRAVAAETEEARTEALAAHTQAVRRHIDDLNVKDYAGLPNIGSPDFVLMFMPIEPAYIEAMKHNRELFDYGYRKNVVMVSHTTLMPILRTVANLWKMDKSNREAREIGRRAGEIYNQVCLVAERLGRLGNSMRAAQGHYNESLTALVGKQGLKGKVERFGELSTQVSKEMPQLEPIEDGLEDRRLESLDTEQGLLESASDKVKPIRADKDT